MIRLYFTCYLFFIVHLSFGQIKVINGKVGVNELSPSAQFEVTSQGNGEKVFACKGSHGGDLFRVQQGGIGNGNFFIHPANAAHTIQFASTGKFFISSPGNVGIDQKNPSFDFELGTENGNSGQAAKPGGGTWAATSDARSKQDITAFKDGLNHILRLNPVQYKYNGKFGTPINGTKYIGLIAQEVQEIAPYMVFTKKYNTATLEEEESPDYKPQNHEKDFLALDSSALIYMFINAFKEQQKLIELQAKRIDILEARLDDKH